MKGSINSAHLADAAVRGAQGGEMLAHCRPIRARAREQESLLVLLHLSGADELSIDIGTLDKP